MKNTAICLVILLLFSVFIGCGKRYPGKEKLYPVSITVTDSNVPLDLASVVLLREGGEVINAGGLTDESGVATIKTDVEWNGIPAGKYLITINKLPSVPEELSQEEVMKLDLRERDAYMSKMIMKRNQLKPVVPPVLTGTKTPISIDVTPGKNEMSIDIAQYWP